MDRCQECWHVLEWCTCGPVCACGQAIPHRSNPACQWFRNEFCLQRSLDDGIDEVIEYATAQPVSLQDMDRMLDVLFERTFAIRHGGYFGLRPRVAADDDPNFDAL